MKTLNKIKSISEIESLENLGVDVDFTPEYEDMQPDSDFQSDIDWISEQLDNGNMAAWFCAKVKLTYKGFDAIDYLGGCSYNSFKEFTTIDKEYYMDMINTCINEINRDIKQYNSEIQKAWNIRKAKNLIAPYGLSIIDKNKIESSYL